MNFGVRAKDSLNEKSTLRAQRRGESVPLSRLAWGLEYSTAVTIYVTVTY